MELKPSPDTRIIATVSQVPNNQNLVDGEIARHASRYMPCRRSAKLHIFHTTLASFVFLSRIGITGYEGPSWLRHAGILLCVQFHFLLQHEITIHQLIDREDIMLAA